jgi:polo-like kinase 1
MFFIYVSNFHYIERKKGDRKDIVTAHTIEKYSKELQKKVTLIGHFKNFLELPSRPNKPMNELENLVYLKKWMKTKHAILFRLSSRMIEVVFENKTEIILRSEARELYYVNKRGEWETYTLSEALTSQNTDMVKRFKYTKEVLAGILTTGHSGSSTSRKTGESNKEKAIATARNNYKEII